MLDKTDALAQVLFNKPSLQECSVEQVAYLAQQYPYFSIAQLALLKKTKAGTPDYEKNLALAALHFSDPWQLDFFLNPAAFQTELFQNPIPASEPLPAIETSTQETAVDSAPESVLMDTPVVADHPLEIATAAPENEDDKKPDEVGALPVVFEPYHAVDYFASQGIKLSQQEATNDSLGKQVKSFTEWLKTMKRLPQAAAAQATDTATEHKVENLAAHSLDTADVVTESMAEVWLKQGNKSKATEVYEKLRVRNPSKNAYFAAKIETLKKV